jgi:hypothetical protein
VLPSGARLGRSGGLLLSGEHLTAVHGDVDGDGQDELLVADLGNPAAFDGIRVSESSGAHTGLSASTATCALAD